MTKSASRWKGLRCMGMGSVFAMGALCWPVVGDEALLDYVELKQRQARALLDNSEIRYSTTIHHANREDGLENSQTLHGEGVEYRQGERRRFDVTYESEFDVKRGPPSARKGNYVTRTSEFTAINEHEVAYWADRKNQPNSELEIWRHTSLEDMNSRASSRVNINRTTDIMDYAFGLANRVRTGPPGDMKSIRERYSKFGTFEAERTAADGSELIRIVHKRDGKIWMTATVDPNKGYATTRLELTSAPDGGEYGKFFESTVEVEEISDGVWAPVSVEGTEILRRENVEYESSVSVSVHSVALDQEFDPALFQWTSLGYSGRRVHLTDEAGIKTLMTKADARLRPHPLSSEALLTPQALAKDIAELVEAHPAVVTKAAEAPATEPGAEPAPDESASSPILAVAIAVAILLLGGIGIVVVRRG